MEKVLLIIYVERSILLRMLVEIFILNLVQTVCIQPAEQTRLNLAYLKRWRRLGASSINIDVAQSAGELRTCESSGIAQETHENRVKTSWKIRGEECKTNRTIAVFKIIELEKFGGHSQCQIMGEVAGFNICRLRKGTCTVVAPDFYYNATILKECSLSRFKTTNSVLPIVVSYESSSKKTRFNLTYTIYEMVDDEEQDQTSTTSFMTVPHRQTYQAPQTSQVAAPLLGIVFGILFGIASVAFVVLLYKFLQQRKEFKEFQPCVMSPENSAPVAAVGNEANVEAVYSQVNKNRGPNNTSEAEVAVNALYHL